MTAPVTENDADSSETPRPEETRRHTVPLSVWAISAFWGCLLLGASLLWPIGTGLDEPAHVDMAYQYSSHPLTFYGPGQLQFTQAVSYMFRPSPDVSSALLVFAKGSRLADASTLARDSRPTLAQLGGQKRLVGAQPNQMVEHPPLYYWLEAAVLRFPGVSSLAWDLQVWLMRLVSVFLVLPIPLLCWATTRRLLRIAFPGQTLRSCSRYAVLAAVLPLTIPNLIRDASSVDNDALLFLTSSVALYGVSRVLSGDLGLGTAGMISIATAAALWTKGFALALPPILLVSYIVGTVRTTQGQRIIERIWKPLLVVAGGCILGGLWWLRNIIDYGTLQPNGFGTFKSVLYGPVDDKGTIGAFFFPFLDQFIMRIWGGIGLPDLPSPGPILIYGWFSVASIAVLAALVVRAGPGSRRSAFVLALVPIAYFAIDIEGSWSDFHKWSHAGIRAAQGRYLYGGLVAVAALFAVGSYTVIRPRLHSSLTPLVVGGAVVTNTAVWFILLRSWYQPRGDQGYFQGTADGVHALLRWSPLPDALTFFLVIALPVVSAAFALVCVFGEVRWRSAEALSDPDWRS